MWFSGRVILVALVPQGYCFGALSVDKNIKIDVVFGIGLYIMSFTQVLPAGSLQFLVTSVT